MIAFLIQPHFFRTNVFENSDTHLEFSEVPYGGGSFALFENIPDTGGMNLEVELRLFFRKHNFVFTLYSFSHYFSEKEYEAYEPVNT